MSATPNIETALLVAKPATPATPSPSLRVYDFDFAGTKYEMDASIAEEERRFYLKMYSTVDLVNQRKVHCTVCRVHIGTAPSAEDNIKMHPILRVTHCVKCHDFYNSGEFSKGEDGSELYCRWCGQGGEVYCCSTCPFVFCKSCIIKNLSRGVITDIEQNENWNCFKCTPKILWPLRAQHWALVNYIQTQKNGLQSMPLSEAEIRRLMKKDSSTCCRLAKAKASGLSDSMESVESNASKRSHTSSITSVKKSPKPQNPPAKRPKSSNDEVVCTPDLLSMLEPDCQISVATKPAARNPVASSNITSTPRIVTVQQNYSGPSPSSSNTSSNGNPVPISRSSLPPPLVLSSSGMRYRQPTPGPVVRRTVVPNAVRSAGPVFHTINGFRVDLNSAAQQDSYRLPNGRLIQVKRQVPLGNQPATPLTPAPASMGAQVIIRQRPAAAPPPRMAHNNPTFGSNMGIYNPQINQQQRAPQIVRVNNGSQVPAINIPNPQIPANSNGGTTIMMTPAASAKGPALVRHVFPNSPIGLARSQLQDKIFNAMEICTHLTGKVQTLTHSNAYNQARSYMDLKELYIHLSYLMTYAIGRFKQLQDKCLIDMREMGFKNDANSLENGQLAAAVDYVCYGQLDDVDLFNTGCNSFHNQVYEYRKSLHANLKDGEVAEPLPPLMPLGVRAEGDPKDEEDDQEVNDDVENDNDEADDFNDDQNDDYDEDDDLDDEYDALGTEESMNRNEQAHAYDRKLTRLIREYPSIWCTQNPDYGKMEVTRKQWRVIASHFPRGDDIKLRWKKVRKRYVRIERILKEGKRFKGYFDKATNYLANRDLPRSEWQPVDCGEGDGDGFERKQLDAIENTIHKEQDDFADLRQKQPPPRAAPRFPVRPLEVRPIDMRIINFAKSHPVLWRKSADPEFNSIDEQTRKSLWLNFWKSAPKKQASDDEENEIEIVEPKTDTITIDSDNEEETPSTSKPATNKDPVTAVMDQDADLDVAAFSSSILASLLEVDISEGSGDVKTHSSVSPGGSTTKKQPRKKTTNKPNPALIILERQRMEEIKKNDAKLKMKVVVKLRRAEEDFEVARKWREYIKEHDSVKANANISDVSQIQRTENQDNIMNNEGDTFDKAATNEKSADLEAEKTETPTRNETSELDIDITKSKDAIVSKDTDCTLDIAKTEINLTIKQSDEPMDITEETEHLQKDIEDKEHVEGEKPAEVMERLEIDEQIETPVDENVAEKIPPEDHVLENTELQEKSDPMDQVCEADEEVKQSDSVIVESNENNFVSPSVEGTTTEVDDEKSRKTESEASTTNANDAEPLLGDIDGDDNKPNAESHIQQSPRAVSEADNEDVTSKMSPIQPDAEQQKDTESSPGKPPTCASSSEVSEVTSTPSEPLAEVDTV